MAPEPLAWCEFHIKRAKALAQFGAQHNRPELREELLDLARQARSQHLLNALQEIERALGTIT